MTAHDTKDTLSCKIPRKSPCRTHTFKRPPDPESFNGYGIAGTVIRRCLRVLARGPEPQRQDGTPITAEARRQVIDDLLRNAECRIVNSTADTITTGDVDFDGKTSSGMETALREFRRVAANTNLGKQIVTVMFDDGSGFAFSDHGYDAYLPGTLRVSPPSLTAVHNS